MSPASIRTTTSLGLAAAALLLVTAACQRPASVSEAGGRLRVAEALVGDAEGYARAESPREFEFPRDHGPHPDYRTEWWYFTGNLEAVDGRRLGYQLTFFRSALAPEMPSRSSAWASRQAWMAHLAVTDVADGSFRAFERFSRAGPGLAGARARPLRVWLEDWWVAAVNGGEGSEEGRDTARATAAAESWRSPAFPARLRAGEGGVALDLRLAPGKPPVLHGESGLSRKGSEPGNASYYYSLTRLETRGTITLDGREHPVRGLSWLDREWSTSALEEDQVGWDWFSLQLTDGWDLMFYRLRRRDGSTDRHSAGSLVDSGGARAALEVDAVELEVTDTWSSPAGDVTYPSRWILRAPGHDLELRVEPLVADQELDLTFRYWEGAVSVRGTHRGRRVEGTGYVELTGYAEPVRR